LIEARLVGHLFNINIGPVHEENILENTPKTPLASFPFSLPKVGIHLVKINIFQRGSNGI